MIESPRSSATPPGGNESRLESKMALLIGYVLLAGVLASFALVLAALLWRWAATGNADFDYQFSGMNFFRLTLSEFGQLLRGELRPRLLLNLGIIVLMLTPFLRVLVSMLYFMIGLKNWKYSLFTAWVLAILTYTLFAR